MTKRAEWFRYRGLEVHGCTLRAHYELDQSTFCEEVTFEGVDTLERNDVVAVAELWYLVAGLSYYKAGAARHVDLGETPVTPAARSLWHASMIDGLGEFSFRNQLDLSDVTVTGGVDVAPGHANYDPTRVITPFGGGIDSVVSVTTLPIHVDQSLFIVSPPSGRFEPLEETALVTGLPIVRATRTLDEQITRRTSALFNGHVPVTAMITLLATAAALADGRGGVVMSNEHSASVPNLLWHDREINHQWSKSWVAEQLISDAVGERVGPEFIVASLLRARSELWVAQQFAHQPAYHRTFRSCNRAFAQDRERRAAGWCGECDKCLFIHLVLAPFISRAQLAEILGVEPLADPRRREQLRTLVGLGEQRKPFECVGDPTECAVALRALRDDPDWRDVENVALVGAMVDPDETIATMLEPQGVSRVPATWLR